VSDLFPTDFFTSRRRFLETVTALGGKAHCEPVTSAGGHVSHDLSIDVAVFGEYSAPKKIVHLAGVHGVEAFAGSAVQFSILNEMPPFPSDTAVVFVHCFNPWGMSNLRRTNEHNVDLNRNFVLPPFERAGAPAGYELVRDLITPVTAPPFSTFALRAALAITAHGFSSLKQAVTGGQFIEPRGLYFGGKELQQEIAISRAWFSEHLSATEHLIVVDVHTGLGSFAEETLLIEYPSGSDEHRRVGEIFGAERVHAPDGAGSINYSATGALCHLFSTCFQKTRIDCVVQEFGTYHALQVLHALVAENVEHHHGRAGPTSRMGQKLKEAFCPDSPRWREQVVGKGRALFSQALCSLAR
jgi:hypothetical protein